MLSLTKTRCYEFEQHFGKEALSEPIRSPGFALILDIQNIKVDIIRYEYQLIDSLLLEDEIRMLSTKDIAAMKLIAIAQRGSKKDFFDLYELLDLYSIGAIFSFFYKKFPDRDASYVIRSLTYFEDAESEEDPIMLKDYNWSQVKERMKQAVSDYMQSL